nr:MAG TPA: hypothetical protein [Caudoviricetes sp.]
MSANKVVFIKSVGTQSDTVDLVYTVATGGGMVSIGIKQLPTRLTTEQMTAAITDCLGFVEGATVYTDDQMTAFVLGMGSSIADGISVAYDIDKVNHAHAVAWQTADNLMELI